jgi:hypothetical protein
MGLVKEMTGGFRHKLVAELPDVRPATAKTH